MVKILEKPLEGFFIGPEKDILLDKLTNALDYFTKYIPESGNLCDLDNIIEKLKRGAKLKDAIYSINYKKQKNTLADFYDDKFSGSIFRETEEFNEFLDEVKDANERAKKGESLDDLLKKNDIKVEGLLKEPEVDLEELKKDIGRQKRVGETMLYNFSLDYFTDKFFKGKHVSIITKYISIKPEKKNKKDKRPKEKVIRREISPIEKDIVKNPFKSLTEYIQKEMGEDYVIISNKMIFEIYDKENKKNLEMKVASRVKTFGAITKAFEKYYDGKEFCDHYNILFILKNESYYNTFKQNLMDLIKINKNIEIIEKKGKNAVNKKENSNKYVSDHIIIEYNGQVIELQVRTEKQHEIATYGSADHYNYKKQKNKELFNTIALETLGLMPYIKESIYEKTDKNEKDEIKYEMIEDELKDILKINENSRKLKDELSVATVKDLYKKIRKNVDEENKQKIKQGKEDEIIDFNKSVYCNENNISICMNGIRNMICYFNGDFGMPLSEKKLYEMFIDTEKHL